MTTLKQNILKAVRRKPHYLRELQSELKVDGNRLRYTVSAMVASGELTMKNGQYAPGLATVENENQPAAIPCTLVKLAARFGFASRDDGEGDIFIPGRALHGAMPKDKIKVRLFDHPRVEGSAEGEVVEVTEPHNTIAGTVVRTDDGRLALEPDGCNGVNLIIRKGEDMGVRPGDKAGALLSLRSSRHADHRVSIMQRFGSSEVAGECAKAILYGREVRQEFPEEVLEEAKVIGRARVTQAEIQHRMDLRGIPIFTIDSAETKDIDDAISLMKLNDGGYELGVHIADVSHYVKPDTELDKEAFERATSIYYADKVIPMLPKQLSNGICSLNEDETRLAFSCLMQLDANGNIRQYRFVKTVIRSRVKGVYKEINALLDDTADEAIREKYAAVSAQLPVMQELYEKRLALRKARGGLDIESTEAKLVLDEKGRCVDVVKRDRGVSECMIEEFMLLANQCAANAGRTHKVPFLYRIHEAPDAERLEKLMTMLKACGLDVRFKGETPTQLELAALLDKTRGEPIQIPVHTGILRSMQKAKYSPEPKGHFGLVLEDYAHFTSPIRRYPDLAIHRILTDMLLGESTQQLTAQYQDFAARACEQSSRKEVDAQRIERDVEDCYKAEYMTAHLGETYTGTVSGITQRGVFVALDNSVEGFVPAAELCKGEPVVTEGVRIYDPLTGRHWMLGDPMQVRAAAANVQLGRIDFTFVP
ncbi:ribonuclease R [uncultured Gemmiger sp.]|uniref:ribonuclease R n=1 Tax=uncultured Gemmiger sp. TaxID=1623490 RepID=UPI0025F0B43F|nr:ribonuclease R [uncultured Gemmiger sp.]